MQVNIPKSINDPSYRYKRDIIKIEIQNSNGGITKLSNIEIISNQLGCQVNDILKFLKKKINTSTIEKNGIFLKKIETQDNIEKIIEDFIKIEILCPKCNNPEFNVESGKKIIKICKACGHSRNS